MTTQPDPAMIERAIAAAEDALINAPFEVASESPSNQARIAVTVAAGVIVPATAERERRRIKSNLNVALAKLGVFNIYVELSEDASDVFIARWTAGTVPSGLSAGATTREEPVEITLTHPPGVVPEITIDDSSGDGATTGEDNDE